ncbi:MAG: 50S ribosomal protein L19 [Candidatus Pacebacteria bacterium]|nr:50S ribosomal protein L19 [Candidatus Paceibacterota bacterium]
MTITLQDFNHNNTRKDLPDVKPGHVIKVYQKIVETKGVGKKMETKERVQVFEGLVIGKKGGTGIGATITVRKISGGIGVEKIFPLNTPTIEKIEIIKITKTRRAKLNYMRDRVGKATKPKGRLASEEDNEPQTKKIKEEMKENEKEMKEENTEDIKENENKEIEEKVEENTEKKKVEEKEENTEDIETKKNEKAKEKKKAEEEKEEPAEEKKE